MQIQNLQEIIKVIFITKDYLISPKLLSKKAITKSTFPISSNFLDSKEIIDKNLTKYDFNNLDQESCKLVLMGKAQIDPKTVYFFLYRCRHPFLKMRVRIFLKGFWRLMLAILIFS